MQAEQLSSREACRKAVAGSYLSTYDKRERAKQFTKLLEEKIIKNKKTLVEKQAEHERLVKIAKESEFDVKKAQDRDGVAATVASLKAVLAQNEKLLEDSRQEKTATEDMVSSLKAKITKVFNIQEITPRRKDSYPIQVVYKSDCSQYRYTCPLTRQEASDLLQLVDDIDGGEPCRKYAAMSGIE